MFLEKFNTPDGLGHFQVVEYKPPAEAPDEEYPYFMVRITHVMDSCVNCGQCQDTCTMELPLSRLIFLLSKKIGAIFKYEPGMNATELPPLRTVTNQELSLEGVQVAL